MPLVQRRMAQYYDRDADRGCCRRLATTRNLNVRIKLTLADYPDDMIRLECSKCSRTRRPVEKIDRVRQPGLQSPQSIISLPRGPNA